jgi:hypothetical protein
MMTINDVCLLEYIGEVEKDRHINLTFNVCALSVAVAMNLSDVENVHLHSVTNFVFANVEVLYHIVRILFVVVSLLSMTTYM